MLWLRCPHKLDQHSGIQSCISCLSRSKTYWWDNALPSVTFWFWPWSFQPSDDFLQRVGSRSPQNTVHKSCEIPQWQNPHELRPLTNCVFVRACLLAQNHFCGHSCVLQYHTIQYSLCSNTVHILQLPYSRKHTQIYKQKIYWEIMNTWALWSLLTKQWQQRQQKLDSI